MMAPLLRYNELLHSDKLNDIAGIGTAVTFSTELAAAIDDEEAVEVATRALAEKLALLMAFPEAEVELHKPIAAFGIDSLVALEVRYWVGRELKAEISVFDIMQTVGVVELGKLVVERSELRTWKTEAERE